MQKNFTQRFVLSLLMLSNMAIYSQVSQVCGTDEVRKKLIETHPEILEREAAFDKMAAERLTSIMRIEDGVIIIPVVFHIIHDYYGENISDAQVYDAIENINRDFSKTNTDFINTIPEFEDIAADCKIEFRLAQKELSSTCTNGIDRIPSLRTYNGSDAAKLGGWQSGKYLNIWVVKNLDDGVAAYAYYPTAISGLYYTVDGVICRYDYVGTIGAAGPYAAHVLSHEIGHYLNLQHVWGNTNGPGVSCGDDQVIDTPITEGWSYCNTAGNSCGGGVDNVQNHMEYSYCTTMFTEGQKERMYAALESDDALRNNLWTEENKILTGTNDGYIAGLCSPKADFYTYDRITCQGNFLSFTDVSFNAPVDSRVWNFEGGIPATSTEPNPSVQFNDLGWHAVSLTVTNASGTSTKNIEKYVYVSTSSPTLNESYFEDFNNEDEVNNNWIFYNKYPDEREWKWRPNNGYYNGGCMWLNSRYGPNLETDVVISPSFNLSSGLTDNLFFKYCTTSYAITSADYTMSLKVYYSINCGDTWVYMNKITGQSLISSYGGSSDFYPIYPDQWAVADINLPEACKTNNVKFKLEFNYNPYVNNIFVDDFNFLSGVLSAPLQEEIIAIKLAPNPTAKNSETMLYYSLKEQQNIDITIHDLYGKMITKVNLGEQLAGSHQYIFNPAEFNITEGCYFMTIGNGNVSVSEKLIVL